MACAHLYDYILVLSLVGSEKHMVGKNTILPANGNDCDLFMQHVYCDKEIHIAGLREQTHLCSGKR